MSYTPPDTWSHGDKPTAAKVNKWKTDLDEIHATAGDRALNLPVRWSAGGTPYFFIHRHRYLHYNADAAIITDPTGAGDPVTLSETTGFGVYDLDSVDWLQYGMLYYVDDCNAAIEYWQA